VKAYEAIVKGENIPEPSIPESFKVLLKEIQSLSLDANVVSEGGDVEIAEEDDDLLKAAEELGMDLTGVRAEDSNGAADEKEEQVVAEGEGGSGDGDSGSDGAEAEPVEAEAKEETKVED
jgi:DNA-directed RNA polymerase subunit beta